MKQESREQYVQYEGKNEGASQKHHPFQSQSSGGEEQHQSPSQNQEDHHDEASSQEEDGRQPYNPRMTINESSTNQMLTVLLQPGETIWYSGQIIASNRPYSNIDNQGFDNFDLDRIFHYLKMKWKVPMKLGNSGLEIAYFCLRKKGGGGKILYLDSETYGQLFAFDMSKLLTISHDPINYELESVPPISYLTKLKLKGPTDKKLCLCLQSNPGQLIYEKSLGDQEKLYVGNSQIIAASEKVEIKRVEGCVVLMGPGLVFLEAPAPMAYPQGGRQLNPVVFLLVFLLMTGLLIIHQALQ